MCWLVYIIKEADFLIFHFFVEDKSNSKKRKREKLVNDMPAQIFNYIVCIHLLILTYKYHCLYELWFMSCMHDSLFVTGNDFMMLAFFFNLITYVFEYLIWFLTSLWLLCHKPFHPRFTYSWFMENQAGKNIQLWLFFFSLLSDSSNPVSSPIIAQTKPRIESADDLEVRLVF